MMVDLMFMIVQSFSFLTAITQTAVAPIAVNLPDVT